MRAYLGGVCAGEEAVRRALEVVAVIGLIIGVMFFGVWYRRTASWAANDGVKPKYGSQIIMAHGDSVWVERSDDGGWVRWLHTEDGRWIPLKDICR